MADRAMQELKNFKLFGKPMVIFNLFSLDGTIGATLC
jgi:hypothetical protein